ncbi:MAG: toll/interleukin-1 receptor domain-containing protein [Chloroflexota bacterium]
MKRLSIFFITTIIAGSAFIYLWIQNPLYAFVGAVVFFVFMLVGLALIFNRPQTSNPAERELLEPRRTGEFRRIDESDLPEASWEDEPSSKKDTLEPPAQQQLYAGSPPPAPPTPAPVVERRRTSRDNDDSTQPFQTIPDSDISGELSNTEVEFSDADDEPVSLEITEEVEESEPSTEHSTSTPLDTVQFSAFYPRQASTNREYGLYVYAHLPDALISDDIQQFASDLGGRIPKATVAKDHAEIEVDAMLSVMVSSEQLTFNQVGVMQQWQHPFVRFDFRFTAHDNDIDDLAIGRIAIMLGLIEIASIDFQVLVIPEDTFAKVNAMPQDPRYDREFINSQPINVYQDIFISYSRKDTFIAEQYRAVQKMIGNTVFMDTHSIRAGEDWERALQRAIDKADIFQLFWSEHSAESEHVRFEWQYALQHRCPETNCVQFIRPAYWSKPLPPIPEELSHLHFAYIELDEENFSLHHD